MRLVCFVDRLHAVEDPPVFSRLKSPVSSSPGHLENTPEVFNRMDPSKKRSASTFDGGHRETRSGEGRAGGAWLQGAFSASDR